MPTRRGTILGVGSLIGLSGCTGTGRIDEPDYTPDYRTVEVENDGNQSREIYVAVSRDGEMLHEGTHDINAGEWQVIFNTSSSELDGGSVNITATTDTDNITISNADYIDGPIQIESGGRLTFLRAEA